MILPRSSNGDGDEAKTSRDWLQKLRQTKQRTDDRDEYLKVWDRMNTLGEGSVWIAKSSAGAKGNLVSISSSSFLVQPSCMKIVALQKHRVNTFL